ncbi:MAG: hypothetical protein AAGD34_19555 [Pseudomonadota bacterium]
MGVVKGVLAASVSLFLAGCYTADFGVLDPDQSVVPQETVTVLIRDEPMELAAEGGAYAIMNPQNDDDRQVLIRLWPVTEDGPYIVAFWPRDGVEEKTPVIIFGVMTMGDGQVEISGDCSGPTLEAALAAGAVLEPAEPRAGRKSCHFDDRESLFAFARAVVTEPLWGEAHKVLPLTP